MISALLLAAATANIAPPTANDLSNAWYARISVPNGMPHCPAIGNFQASPTRKSNVFKVRYGFIRQNGPERLRYSAKLRLTDSSWVWESGDFPRCSVMIISED